MKRIFLILFLVILLPKPGSFLATGQWVGICMNLENIGLIVHCPIVNSKFGSLATQGPMEIQFF